MKMAFSTTGLLTPDDSPGQSRLGVMSNEVGQGSVPNFRCSAKVDLGPGLRVWRQSAGHLSFSRKW